MKKYSVPQAEMLYVNSTDVITFSLGDLLSGDEFTVDVSKQSNWWGSGESNE